MVAGEPPHLDAFGLQTRRSCWQWRRAYAAAYARALSMLREETLMTPETMQVSGQLFTSPITNSVSIALDGHDTLQASIDDPALHQRGGAGAT